MMSLGGTESPVACLSDSSACIHITCCAQRDVWRSVAEAVYDILDSTTIEDLVNSTLIRLESEKGMQPIVMKTAV